MKNKSEIPRIIWLHWFNEKRGYNLASVIQWDLISVFVASDLHGKRIDSAYPSLL